jgi:transposase
VLSIPRSSRIFIYSAPVDMRVSFDGLATLVKDGLKQNSFSGHLFVFFSRCKRKIKLLQWERDGYSIYYHRLEQGGYDVSVWLADARGPSVEVDSVHFAMLLAGINFKETKRQKRYSRESLAPKLQKMGVADSEGYVSP